MVSLQCLSLRSYTTLRNSFSSNRVRSFSSTSLLTSNTFTNSSAAPFTSPFAPRHFISIGDLSPAELATLVRNGSAYKHFLKSSREFTPSKSSSTSTSSSNRFPLRSSLSGHAIAIPMSKRSTRTRVSTEAAVAAMGGHPMFLGSADIQLNVNESLHDTSVVISSMVSAIVARVGPHSDILGLAQYSSKPVINALCDRYHPLQVIADIITVHEVFRDRDAGKGTRTNELGLDGIKFAWVGDANNVLNDLALAAGKIGAHVHVATPRGFEISKDMLQLMKANADEAGLGGTISTTNVPEEAVRDADIIFTDTWVSMGQEAEKADRLKQFKGFQVTAELAKRGGAKDDWKFMHCLPRKPEEVSDDVFYNPQRSLVFTEAENRVYSAISALEAFVVNRGNILDYET